MRRPTPPTTSPTNRSFTADDSAKLIAVETSAAQSLPQAVAPVLEARDLVKRFGDRVALRGVSLAAGRGDLVAVIGPNGAGKTTLLSILAGIQRPDEGSISRAPRELGWVPQQPALYSKLTVAENLELFARASKGSRTWARRSSGCSTSRTCSSGPATRSPRSRVATASA